MALTKLLLPSGLKDSLARALPPDVGEVESAKRLKVEAEPLESTDLTLSGLIRLIIMLLECGEDPLPELLLES